MSLLLNGLTGIAIKIVPSLFKVLTADREKGDIWEAASDIVKRHVATDNEDEAKDKISKSSKLEASIRIELAELELKAIEQQNRAAKAQIEMDKAFLDLERAERDQRHQEKLDFLDAEFASVTAARDHALQLSKSERWWVAGINPLLSVLLTLGFIGALFFIVKTSEIKNVEIFYTAIGTLATAFATIVAFHFGSSSGSRVKDDMIISSPSEVDGSDEDISPTSSGDLKFESDMAIKRVNTTPQKITKPLPDPGGQFGLFRQKAPGIMQDLMSDFGLTLDQAGGILGNAGHECMGFRTLQEIKPIVPGSRGGWGWFQWTGPRRREFEKWCQNNGYDNLSADDANYGFLKHELETTEKNALGHLKRANSLRDATRSFMDKFERPGVKHLNSRINWAQEAIKAYRNSFS